MSHADPAVDARPDTLPLDTLFEALDALGVTFRRKGEGLALRNAALLTAELLAAVADHKPALLALCDRREEMNAELERLHGYIIRLRCSDPPKGTRAQAIRYHAQQIERLAALSVASGGTEDGWDDFCDPFTDGDQILGLRAALAELTRADAPYPLPLPEGCTLLPQANFDVFAHGRLFNGMASGGGLSQPSAASGEPA